MAGIDRAEAKRRFLAFLERKNLRLTAQRRAIIETVFSTDEHFTAEQLLAWSRRRDRSVSRATVYRTLPLLTESGLVRELDFGKEQTFYDLQKSSWMSCLWRQVVVGMGHATANCSVGGSPAG